MIVVVVVVVVVGEEKLLLSVVGPVSPSLSGEVATEEASHLFCSHVPAVEKTSRCEVVCFLVDLELLVRSEGLVVWAMLYLTKALKDALGCMVLRHRFPFQ
jgi:hypothetical protein